MSPGYLFLLLMAVCLAGAVASYFSFNWKNKEEKSPPVSLPPGYEIKTTGVDEYGSAKFAKVSVSYLGEQIWQSGYVWAGSYEDYLVKAINVALAHNKYKVDRGPQDA